MTSLVSVLKNAGFVFFADVISRVLSFVFILIIARSLGDVGLGQYSFIFSFAGLFAAFYDLGMGYFLIKEVSRNKNKASEIYSAVLSTKAIIGSIVAIITAILITFSAEDKAVVISVYIAAGAMLVYHLKEALLSVFVANENMKFVAGTRLLDSFIIVGVGSLVLLNGVGIIILTSVFLSAYLTTFFISLISVKKYGKLKLVTNKEKYLSIIKASIPFWLAGIFSTIYLRIDTVMLGFLAGFSDTGIYSASFKLLDALYFIPQAVITAIFPVMSRLHKNDKATLKRLYHKAFYYLLILALPMGLGVTLLADRIIYFIYGAGFMESAPILRILIWVEVFAFMYSVSGFLLNSIDKQKVFTYVTAGAALLNVIMNFILIPKYGPMGAAYATLTTQFFILVGLFYFASRAGYYLNILKLMWKSMIATIIMGLVVYFTIQYHIVIIVIIGITSYGIIMLGLRGIEEEEIQIAKKILRKIKL